jgi:hypothetical protein
MRGQTRELINPEPTNLRRKLENGLTMIPAHHRSGWMMDFSRSRKKRVGVAGDVQTKPTRARFIFRRAVAKDVARKIAPRHAMHFGQAFQYDPIQTFHGNRGVSIVNANGPLFERVWIFNHVHHVGAAGTRDAATAYALLAADAAPFPAELMPLSTSI